MTNLDTYRRYLSSNMILMIDSDTAYLVLSESKSRIASYYYLSNHSNKTSHPYINSIILVECKVLKYIVSSSTEVETTGMFHNAQTTIPIQYILEKLNYFQPATSIITNNSIVTGFVHKNIS